MVGSNSTFRDEWLEGAARAFFVSAYADYVEEGFSTDNDLSDYERKRRLALPRARNGEAWANVAPSNPPNAYALAGELWAMLEVANPGGCGVYTLAQRAARADSECTTCKGTGVCACSSSARWSVDSPLSLGSRPSNARINNH